MTNFKIGDKVRVVSSGAKGINHFLVTPSEAVVTEGRDLDGDYMVKGESASHNALIEQYVNERDLGPVEGDDEGGGRTIFRYLVTIEAETPEQADDAVANLSIELGEANIDAFDIEFHSKES